MVQWELCPSCRKVVDEFENECGWCFSKRKSSSDERQLFLFDVGNFGMRDSVNSADPQGVGEHKLKKEKNV